MAITPRLVFAHLLRETAFAGYRVAVISDFHIAPWHTTRVLASAVDSINAWQPDLIALVGDYGYSVRQFPALSRACYRVVMPRVTSELARLRARDGVCAVLGNHDSDGGSRVVERALTDVAVRVLRNASYEITRGGTRLRIIGVDDMTHGITHAADLTHSTLTSVAGTLLLSHHPDYVFACEHYSRASPLVVLAGHTHGGQITLPRIGAPITLSRAATHLFPAGFVPNEHATLYVTRGLGEQIPLRVRAPREITFLELAQR